MREAEFCSICHEFTECFKYRKHWLCPNCPKSEIDRKIEDDIDESEQPISRPVQTAIKKKTRSAYNSKPKKVYIENIDPPKPSRKSGNVSERACCKKDLMEFFENNPDAVFTTYEVIDKFPNYDIRNVKNFLSILVGENFLYSRLINVSGRNKYAIYSMEKEKVTEFRPEENILQMVEYIKKKYPVTTRELSEKFPITSEAIGKRLKKVDEIDMFHWMNRNFYFPKNDRDYSINYIKQNITWKNQWTS